MLTKIVNIIWGPGDPGRFRSLGELVAEVYHGIWTHNNTRIHSALKMPPAVFAEQFAEIFALAA